MTVDRDRLPNYLFISIKKCYELLEGFYLPEPKIKPLPKVKIDYKKLAEEYKSFIEAGVAKNQAELARKLKVSRAWVTKVLKKL